MEKKGNNIGKVLIYIGLSLLVVIYVLPLFWIFMVSLKTNKELMSKPFALPESLQWDHYASAWTNASLGTATLNSTIVCVAALAASLLVSAMAAFAIGRMRFKLSKFMGVFFLIGMMVPGHCVLMPLYKTFADLELTDTLIGLIIPYTTFALPMTVFILTGFFEGMPNELLESACIDGCSIYECFFRIALPLSKTGLFVTGLMSFVGNWNELLLAMVFINDEEFRTLPVALTSFVGPYATNYVEMFAAVVIAVVPTIVVYSMFSNQIVDGLTQGAVKG